MTSEYVPLLVVLVIVWMIILPWIAFMFGRKIGRECPCCGFGLMCNPCNKSKCPKGLHPK